MMLHDLTKSSNFIGVALLNKGSDYQDRMYVDHSTNCNMTITNYITFASRLPKTAFYIFFSKPRVSRFIHVPVY